MSGIESDLVLLVDISFRWIDYVIRRHKYRCPHGESRCSSG